MNIYVGNLTYSVTEEEIKTVFTEFGVVDQVTLIRDRNSGNSKGFGFIEMNNEEEAKKAIAELDGKDLGGRNLRVNEARPKTERPS